MPYDWTLFQSKVRQALSTFATVVGEGVGNGVGTDGVNADQAEDTAIFIAVNPTDINRLRVVLSFILTMFGQTSACFALDTAHEPCFATRDGNREVTS